MKLSFMSFTCPEATLAEFLGYAQKHGYLSGEYIDAWLPDEVLPHEARVLRGYMQ